MKTPIRLQVKSGKLWLLAGVATIIKMLWKFATSRKASSDFWGKGVNSLFQINLQILFVETHRKIQKKKFMWYAFIAKKAWLQTPVRGLVCFELHVIFPVAI